MLVAEAPSYLEKDSHKKSNSSNSGLPAIQGISTSIQVLPEVLR